MRKHNASGLSRVSVFNITKHKAFGSYFAAAAVCSSILFWATGSPGLVTYGLLKYANSAVERSVAIEGVEWAKEISSNRFVICFRVSIDHSSFQFSELDISTNSLSGDLGGFVRVGEESIAVERWLHGYYIAVPVVNHRQECGLDAGRTGVELPISTEQLVRYIDKRDRSTPDFVALPGGVNAAIYLRNVEVLNSQHRENFTIASSNRELVRTENGPASNYLIVLLKGDEVRPNAGAETLVLVTMVFDFVTSPLQLVPALVIYIWAAPGMV